LGATTRERDGAHLCFGTAHERVFHPYGFLTAGVVGRPELRFSIYLLPARPEWDYLRNVDEGAPGLGYASKRLLRIAFPKIHITRPVSGIRVERDVPILLSDGTTLRANVFRPDRPGHYPVLMSAHPYGKDVLPRRSPFGYLPLTQYRFIRSPDPITFSAYTSWEAPDPCFWVPRGYSVINVDLRGFGSSEGVGILFSDQEAEDIVQVIDWAAAQSWSSGKVGMNGVSYLAISQWKVAALRPKSLSAICPWEGFTDVYRDVAYPGGVREDGFIRFWASMTERAGYVLGSLRADQLAHPDWDDFWAERAPALERIEVPALICASFSDQALHTRGSFEAFRRIGSKHRFLYTHRGGKWSTYYSPASLALQARFFDCFLKGEDNGMVDSPRVRLEVRASGDRVHAVRDESAWPLPRTRWTRLFLGPGELREETLGGTTTVDFDAPWGGVSFAVRAPQDFELSGPMKLRLKVELNGGSDAYLFVAVRKFDGKRSVAFEGPFGFGRDVVTKGWMRLAHRRLDESRSEPHRPFHPCDRAEPLPPGEVAEVEIELMPSSTFFRRDELMRLDVQGHWFWRRSALFGMFPGDYTPSAACKVILHLGGKDGAHLLVPRIV
jgi:predicted acyl esterase